MHAINSTPSEAIWGGFMAFGICSFFGLRLLLRGLRGDTLDSSGHTVASRGWFILGGMLLQLPLVGFTLLAWKQGFFNSDLRAHKTKKGHTAERGLSPARSGRETTMMPNFSNPRQHSSALRAGDGPRSVTDPRFCAKVSLQTFH